MNDRLVSTDAVMASVCNWYNRKATKDGLRLAYIESAVNDTPTFSTPSGWVSVDDRLPEDDGDVAEVIKCKDCKWSDEYYHCDRVAWWNTADDFCSRGERKDG
jgi:hypothetical protein